LSIAAVYSHILLRPKYCQ